MAASAERQTRRFTVDEVLAMVDAGILREDERLELLDGELIVMPPQGPPHAGTTTRLDNRLHRIYGTGYVVREAKPMIADERSLPEPDHAVFRGDERSFDARHPRGDEAVLIIEVAWSSQSTDRSKAALYARAGVPIYWLLDIDKRRLEVYSDPLGDGEYSLVRILGEHDEVTPPETTARWCVTDLLP